MASFWTKLKYFGLQILGITSSGQYETPATAIMAETIPGLPPSIGEMAAKTVESTAGFIGKIGSWIKTILILIVVILGLWLFIRAKK